MTNYTLGTAAKATGLAKSTILRAIKAGRVSAIKGDTGDWSIDPAELHRVFPAATAEPGAAERGATAPAQLEAEIKSLREITDLLRSQLEDTRTDRDAWRDQAQTAQRLLTNANAPATNAEPQRRGIISKLFG